MKKIIRLTESDLVRLVKRVIKEQLNTRPAVVVPGGVYQQKNLITSKLSEGIKNISKTMLESEPFPGQLSGYGFGGEFQGMMYYWNGQGVQGMPGVRGIVNGEIETYYNSIIIEDDGITDADPKGIYIGFVDPSQSTWVRCYRTTSNTTKCYTK